MTRVRRVRWIAGVGLVATVVTTLTVGARAFAHEDSTARCTPPPAVAGPVHHDPSWRTGALRVMGCHAWHHMRNNPRMVMRISR